MVLPYLLSLCIFSLLSPIFATPLNQGTSQFLVQPASLDAAPVAPPTTNLTTPDNDLGCFKDRPWPSATKDDCEAALDYWVAGESLNTKRLFSRKIGTSHMSRIHLPFKAFSNTCQVWINVVGEDDEEILSLGDVYAQVLGPDGSAKNCLGQHGLPPIGGRMSLGSGGKLSVSISGVKQ
ncbi:hypothetical protein ACLMJK_003406 [Lecanora helva]